ncbi:hypothetical protein OJ997_00920 [Solirubrobacter phytolaccae]|uniref:Uncharacterized protein n=1 Tax=Solirubrobacter phytolaccae TaxID=1404360 RepID=A0A9X3N6W5_9ACTN|nr:hypothetical protein [Solirubrobacter phytolaccae]MDA0178841.1 hypothetical protein [Solirubrobacter phytolaccae]
MTIAAIAAWTIAVAETTEAVATAFAVAGFALIAAAAFYSRVIRVGKEGVDLAQVVDIIEGTATEEGDTPDETKARAIEQVQRLALPAGEATAPSRPAIRQALMERDRVEANLKSYFASWLQAQGYSIQRIEERRGDVRADMVAVRQDDDHVDRLVVEIRPAIAILRPSHVGAILARDPIGLDATSRRGIVLQGTAIVMPEARDQLAEAGVTVFRVDPEFGYVEETAPAKRT